jgi:hypothetical protein
LPDLSENLAHAAPDETSDYVSSHSTKVAQHSGGSHASGPSSFCISVLGNPGRLSGPLDFRTIFAITHRVGEPDGVCDVENQRQNDYWYEGYVELQYSYEQEEKPSDGVCI